ncbi:MAG TPA: hypothetical protein RMH99_02325 [Sandaracinaceae bacterium LLY-WYZ-13_1]|nr:hypothetical protein [Sandaracinaceae bacterium LLY-WYZ-13_1]
MTREGARATDGERPTDGDGARVDETTAQDGESAIARDGESATARDGGAPARLAGALDRGPEAFDEVARPLATRGRLVETLVALAPPEARARGDEVLRAPRPGALPVFDVGAIAKLGRPGLWLATAWALEVIPGRVRGAPSPPFERWDALIEIHRARPEAAWLSLELFVALTARQEALGRRALLGLRRRFGDRGVAIAEHQLASRDVALAPLLRDAIG